MKKKKATVLQPPSLSTKRELTSTTSVTGESRSWRSWYSQSKVLTLPYLINKDKVLTE